MRLIVNRVNVLVKAIYCTARIKIENVAIPLALHCHFKPPVLAASRF